eukprot:284819823_5
MPSACAASWKNIANIIMSVITYVSDGSVLKSYFLLIVQTRWVHIDLLAVNQSAVSFLRVSLACIAEKTGTQCPANFGIVFATHNFELVSVHDDQLLANILHSPQRSCLNMEAIHFRLKDSARGTQKIHATNVKSFSFRLVHYLDEIFVTPGIGEFIGLPSFVNLVSDMISFRLVKFCLFLVGCLFVLKTPNLRILNSKQHGKPITGRKSFYRRYKKRENDNIKSPIPISHPCLFCCCSLLSVGKTHFELEASPQLW